MESNITWHNRKDANVFTVQISKINGTWSFLTYTRRFWVLMSTYITLPSRAGAYMLLSIEPTMAWTISSNALLKKLLLCIKIIKFETISNDIIGKLHTMHKDMEKQ